VSNGRTVLVLLGILVVAAAVLFSVQNSTRTTQLSFDLGVAAWQLQQPVSVPALIGACFGAGVLVGVIAMGFRVAHLTSKVRQLEQQVAVGSIKDGAEPARW